MFAAGASPTLGHLLEAAETYGIDLSVSFHDRWPLSERRGRLPS